MSKNVWKRISIYLSRNIAQNIGVGLLIMICILFLSLCTYFEYDESNEEETAQTLNLKIQIEDDHLLGKDVLNDLSRNKYLIDEDYFMTVYNWIEKIGNHEYFESFNYSIQGSFLISDTQYLSLYGYNDESYFSLFNRELLEGRLLTNGEILNGKSAVIVSNDTTYNLKDILQFYDTYELEVLGIIKYETYNNTEFGLIDKAGKNNGIFLSNQLLKEIIHEQNINVQNLFINEIYFMVKDYSDYLEAKEFVKDSISDLNQMLSRNGYPAINMGIKSSSEENLLKSISYIHLIYQVIFYICFVIVVGILVSVLNYILNNKKNEIKIYYALGYKKHQIIVQYLLCYLIIAFVFIPIGIWLAYVLSGYMVDAMVVQILNDQKLF